MRTLEEKRKYQREWSKEWRKNNPEKAKQKRKDDWLKYKTKYPERIKEQKKKMWQKHKVKEMEGHKKRLKEWRRIVLTHYSKGKLECECCGEKIYQFLTINHINGGGSKERKELGAQNIPRVLINKGFPEGYNILCYNCNCGMRDKKICPHKLIDTD